MFKSNKFLYFIIGAVTTLFLAIPVYADQNIFNVTPLQNETWTAGETKTVTWTNNISFICASDSGSVVLSLGLFALGADGTPIYRASGGGQYIYDYPGVFVSPTSGTIGLPANAVPGQYKVVARCFNPPSNQLGVGISDGVVTIPTPPPTITLTAPTGGSYTTNQSIPVAWTITNSPAGATVGLRLEDSNNIRQASVGGLTGSSFDFNLFDLGVPAGTYHFEAELKVADGITILAATGADFTVTTVAVAGPYTITTVIRSGRGFISKDSRPPYSAGTVVELKAIPAAGYTFTSWDDDLTGTTNPTTITMNEDKNVTADFATITAPPPTGSSITLTAPRIGDEWIVGSRHDITWTSVEVPNDKPVKLRRKSATNPLMMTELIDLGPNDGSYTVNSVPDAPGVWRYEIYSTGADGALVLDEGDEFTIKVAGSPDPDPNPPGNNPSNTVGWRPPKGEFPSPGVYIKTNGDAVCDDPGTPGCNPPINVSSVGQWKDGAFGAKALATQLFQLTTLPTAGYVLTSDAVGNGTWQPGGGPDGAPPSTLVCDGITKKLLWSGVTWSCGDDLQGTGPVGPQGPAGADGAVGPQGPAGANGTGSGTVTSVTAGNGLDIKEVAGDTGGSITSSGTIRLRQDCAPDKILKVNDAGDWACSSDAGGIYTADDSTLQLSASKQFSIKPAASTVTGILGSVNGVVGWGNIRVSSTLRTTFSDPCTATGGLGHTNTCDIGPLADYAFCALNFVDTDDGKCEVGRTANKWVINVKTDIGITTCRATCFN